MLPSILFSPGESPPRPALCAAETILRLCLVSPVAGGNHPGFTHRQRRVRRAAHGRRQVAVLSTPRPRAIRTDGGRLAADRLDEGPGGRAPGGGRGGNIPEFLARRR